MTRVSIIMGIYNCAETLPAAIESILAQTFQSWKLILCDDGSSDNTVSVAKVYCEQYPEKMVLIHNKINMGLNYTLNHCLQYADTEYVARMDGDDISLPTRLEKEVGFLDEHPEYSVVSTLMVYFDECGDWGRCSMPEIPTRESLAYGTPFCHAPCMVRKEAYNAVGGYTVHKHLLRMEDYHLWMKMFAKGYKGYNLQEVLYKMRDDRNATRRRAYKYRINEAYVKLLAIKTLRLPKKYIINAFRPLIVGLLPAVVYEHFHRKRLRVSD